MIPTVHFDGGTKTVANSAMSSNSIYWGYQFYMEDKIVWADNGIDLSYETNNEAEYMALIKFLEWFINEAECFPFPNTAVGYSLPLNFHRTLEIRGDSKLVLEQVFGSWKVKAENLIPLHWRAQQRIKEIEKGQIKIIYAHSRRETARQKSVDAWAREAQHWKSDE
jgi:ribonuclease HI